MLRSNTGNTEQKTTVMTPFSRIALLVMTQLVFTSSKLTIETLEQGVKYVQS